MSCLNILNNFEMELYKILLPFLSIEDIDRRKTKILQKHDKNLNSSGDFSFPLLIKYWSLKEPYSSFLSNDDSTTFSIFLLNNSQSNQENLQHLVEQSCNWELQLSRAHIHNQRVLLFLNRITAFQTILHRTCFSLDTSFHKNENRVDIICDLDIEEGNEINLLTLTQWRMILVKKVLGNILSEMSSEETFRKICLSIKQKTKEERNSYKSEKCKYIFCAPITSLEDSKKSNLQVANYIELRTIDLTRERIERPSKDLVVAASAFELLSAKTKQTLQLRLQTQQQIANRQNNHRGTIFILYNYARVASLLKQFEQFVQANYYPKLIDFQEINWSLLDKEDEWILVFNYILPFENLHQEIIQELNDLDSLSLNLQLYTSFLSNLSLSFSRYYRRIRILIEPRPHLLPSLYARIYLLKGIQKIFLRILNLLNITPFDHL